MNRTLLVLMIVLLFVLVGCNTTVINDNRDSGNVNMEFNDNHIVEESTYENNGRTFVKYNDAIYYREYNETSESEFSTGAHYDYMSDNPKMIKKLDSNNQISDLFSDNGEGIFYIVDGRFYFDSGTLYTVDMAGKNRIDLGVGSYIFADEKNHKVYYRNNTGTARLKCIDTISLETTEVTDKDWKFYLFVYNDNAFYAEYNKDDKHKVDIVKYDLKTKDENIILSLEDSRKSETYLEYGNAFIHDWLLIKDKLFLVIGIYNTDDWFLGNGVLYEVDLLNYDTNKLDTDVDSELMYDNDTLFYSKITEEHRHISKSININTRQITDELDEYVSVKDGYKIVNKDELTVINNDKKIAVFSSADREDIYSKYLSQYDEKDRLVNIVNIEYLDNKIFYTVQANVHYEYYDTDNELGYRHISSEIHCYDIGNDSDTVLYSYEIEE